MVNLTSYRANRVAVVLLSLLLTAATAVGAEYYEFQELPVPGPVVVVSGLNNAGAVSGWTFDPANFTAAAFVSDTHSYTTYNYPGSPITIFNGISDRGTVTGHVVDATGSHGLLFSPHGEPRLIDLPGSEGGSWLYGINNRGTTTGLYCDNPLPLCEGQPRRSFVRTKRGVIVLIDFPGAMETAALGINDRGRLVGTYQDAGGTPHGFVWTRSRGFASFDVPGATLTQAIGINNRGEVVGAFVDKAGDQHGFLRLRNGDYLTIDYPGSSSTSLAGITDGGDIAGVFTDPATGQNLGFVATRR